MPNVLDHSPDPQYCGLALLALFTNTVSFNRQWMDTCCIDKSSSAELSEAINSMFAWYQQADVCLVYLHDVDSSLDPSTPGSVRNSLRSSDWFNRGWTLQELVAPSVVYFHGSDWRSIGSRTSLKAVLSEITSIDVDLFSHGRLSRYSIAQKMSWAAKRETTRVEDEAYCLMGLFDINMPLLYGEGRKAFRRLQEEIIRRSDDQSIFVHASNDDGSILADSPSAFSECGQVVLNKDSQMRIDSARANNESAEDTQRKELANVSKMNDPQGIGHSTVDTGASITSKGIVTTLAFLTGFRASVLKAIPGSRLFSPGLKHTGEAMYAILDCRVGYYSVVLHLVLLNNGSLRYVGAALLNDPVLGPLRYKRKAKTVTLSTSTGTEITCLIPPLDLPPWSIKVTYPNPIFSGLDFSSDASSLGPYELRWKPTNELWLEEKHRGSFGKGKETPMLMFERPEPGLCSPSYGPRPKHSGFVLRVSHGLGKAVHAQISCGHESMSYKHQEWQKHDEDNDECGFIPSSSGESVVATSGQHGGETLSIQADVRKGPRGWGVTIAITKVGTKRKISSVSDSEENPEGSTRRARVSR